MNRKRRVRGVVAVQRESRLSSKTVTQSNLLRRGPVEIVLILCGDFNVPCISSQLVS